MSLVPHVQLYPDSRSRIRDARALVDRLPKCQCGEILSPRGHCLNVGGCDTADRAATRSSLRRGTAASARYSPARI